MKTRSAQSSLHRYVAMVAVSASALSCATFVGGGAAYAGGCPDRVTSQAFRSIGDEAQYFRAKNGGFEKKTAGWQTTGKPTVIEENAPWWVGGADDQRSLALSTEQSASIKTFCIWDDEDKLRFFYKSPGVDGAKLEITVTVKHGKDDFTMTTTVDGSTPGWQISGQIPTNVLPDSGHTKMAVSFAPSGTPATWLIDDLMIDPWKTR